MNLNKKINFKACRSSSSEKKMTIAVLYIFFVTLLQTDMRTVKIPRAIETDEHNCYFTSCVFLKNYEFVKERQTTARLVKNFSVVGSRD